MSNTNANAILALAASTTLPSDSPPRAINTSIPTQRPFTRSQASVTASARPIPLPPLTQTRRSARNKRSHDFVVFVDPLTSTEPTNPTSNGRVPKRSKTGRKILGVRTLESANSTPQPSPRTPDTPFPFSFEDPLWENVENFDPPTDAPMPLENFGMNAANRPFVTAPATGPLPRRSPRTPRARRLSSLPPSPPRLPRNMELYTILGIDDFGADSDEIRAAYRRAALEQHPDRASEENRGEATLRMQQLNVARDLLLNEDTRRQYHIDGQVPWVEIV